MNFGILLVQGLVNSFGVVTMAAFAIGVKIDTFAYMPAQEFGNAFATYVAQTKEQTKLAVYEKDSVRQLFAQQFLVFPYLL